MRSVSAAVAACVLALASGCSSEGSRPECVGTAADALRTCATGTTLKGIDVSVYQGNVDWTQVKSAGQSFAFVRASAGVTSPDTKFAQNWPGVRAAGLVRGVYQYFRPSQDAAAQAKLLLDKVDAAGGFQPGDLPPVLDLETTDSLASATVVARAKIWLAAVEAKVGKKPIIYTAAFMSDVVGSHFSGYPLWVANYGVSCPAMPSGWTSWHFWQSSDSGSVAGISGAVDLDHFNGTMAQLKALALQPAPSAPSQPTVIEPRDQPPSGGAIPNDGSEGETLGHGPPPEAETTGAPFDPCASR